MPMSQPPVRSRAGLAAVLLVAAVSSSLPFARGQAAATKDEIVTLSRFDVRESADNSFSIANATAGLTFQVPLDLHAERNSYRASLIGHEQAKRELERTTDEIRRDILNSLRELQQIESRIELQTTQIERERRAVAVTQVRYESGDAETRDVLDARQGLTTAQNALIDLKVQHFIGRLRLLRNMGVFFVNDNGMWKR